MVTYTELFMFVTVIVEVIRLCIAIYELMNRKNKK